MKPVMNRILEFTPAAIGLGILFAVILTAANVYLGLYAGMTVCGSIPAAVMAMGIFKVLSKQDSLYQSNIVQTIASAGSSISAGIIFTVPALLMVGAWQHFAFWPTTLIALTGGLLGVVFMIPLRKALIVDDKTLTFPEGVACAAVLQTGSEEGSKGFMTIIQGFAIGGVFKFLLTGMKVFQGTVEKAFFAGDRVLYTGSDISPALLAIGYIVRLDVAVVMLLGGLIGWLVGIPLMALSPDQLQGTALDAAWDLWSKQIRYLGVGAMLVGGVWSIISVRKGIVNGMKELKKATNKGQRAAAERTETNMALMPMLVIFVVCIAMMLGLYNHLIGSLGQSLLTTGIMILAGFIFVAVSSYVVGLVGSSNNPVSGMTISVLLVSSVLFLVFGIKGNSAILATLGVAAIVCCATCSAGDTSQDLKTGYIVGATPKWQQWGALIGVVFAAFIIAPVLTLLHSAYGIGTGLKAPQAALFASITNAMFGNGDLPKNMVIMGMILGIVVLLIDQLFLVKKKSKFRLYLMPLAVGIYLPVTLAVPIFVGGLIRHMADKGKQEHEISDSDSGVLFSSGLIAGESIMGVILAVFIYLKIDISTTWLSAGWSSLASLVALSCVGWWLYRFAKKV